MNNPDKVDSSPFHKDCSELFFSQLLAEKQLDFFDHMLDSFAIHKLIINNHNQPVDFVFIFVNKAFEASTGLKKEQVEGKKVSEIFDVETKWIDKFSQVALTGEPAEFNAFFAGLNKYFTISCFSPAKEYFASFFRDITKQKIAENKLIESEGRYRRLIDSLPERVFMKDINSVYVSCNSSYAKELGINQDEIKGINDYDLFSKDLADEYRAGDQYIINSGERKVFIESYRINDIEQTIHTTKIPVTDSTGKVIGLIGILKDISKELKAQVELKKSEEKYRTLIDNAPEAIFITDTSQDGVILDANDTFATLFGLTKDEVLKKTCFELSPEVQSNGNQSLDKAKDYIKLALAGQTPVFEWDILNLKENTIIPCEVRLVKMNNINESLIRGSIIDISERKNLEDRLRQSEKMQAIGQLAGGIAHDFNNQLSGIMGYADLLLKELKDETLREYAEGIVTSADRAANLTQQLLAFSRKDKHLLVTIDIHKVIIEVVSLLRHSIDKRIQISQFLNASPSIIRGDPTQLQNAILNIAINARDAMPEGGTLTFETCIAFLAEDYCYLHYKNLKPGNYFKITISDTGHGIDSNIISRIFEPFFTTKANGQGTGMGLASAYATVKNHHGVIDVTSENGKGSTFTIFLPATESSLKTDDEEIRITSSKGSERILLVDDETIVRKLGASMLKDLGYRVTTCEDGASAISLYEKEWQSIDLVVLDMIMPYLSGEDTFKGLKEINPHVKALLSSGYSLNSQAQEIINLGVLDFIGKPYRQKELAEKVRIALSV